MLGPCWEYDPVWLGSLGMLNTSESPNVAKDCFLSQILQDSVPSKYYLTKTACLGILRRSKERGKPLPPTLEAALRLQAGLPAKREFEIRTGDAYHINQRNEGIDLHGVSGALMHTQNMQMQTFVTQQNVSASIDEYDDDLISGEASAAEANREMPVSKNGVIAFAANQRDEVRDLHDLAGALGAQPGIKQQTFVASGVVSKGNGECFLTPDKHTSLTGGGGQAGQGYPCVLVEEEPLENCLTPWDTQQTRIFSPDGKAPTMAGADGGGGRNPAGLLFAAGFCAGAGPSAGGIGYTEEKSPTLKASESGTNMVPSILCLNDQGGSRIDLSENISGTLRSEEHNHQPLVLATQQGGAEIGEGICPTITAAAGMSGNNQPVLFENHGIDSRYRGPLDVAPTMSARYGTGGNNLPLVGQADPPAYCIVGNVIDRQPENGGNGCGYQEELAYTLTATDHHAVFARQRTDAFCEDEIASTESARQHKDATDLVLQETVGALTSSDPKDPNNQYVSQDKCVVEGPHLIRRLTPTECERLQGYPDGWTDLPGASDSVRYKALGNSVAIPCVEAIMEGISRAARSNANIWPLCPDS